MFKRFKINRCQLNYKNRCDEQTGGFYMNVKSIDIARALGISKSTVSLALNGKPGVSEQTRQEVHHLTSQIPVSNWYDAIGEPTVANAVLDRIVQIELTGESVRKIKAGKNK